MAKVMVEGTVLGSLMTSFLEGVGLDLNYVKGWRMASDRTGDVPLVSVDIYYHEDLPKPPAKNAVRITEEMMNVVSAKLADVTGLHDGASARELAISTFRAAGFEVIE